MNYLYFTNCSQCDDTVELLNAMVEAAQKTTYKEMLENCLGLLEWSESVGYDPHCDEGLALENDSMVDYFRSSWDGIPCLFLSWSGFEFIWLEVADASEEEKNRSVQKARDEGDRVIHPAVSTLGRALGLV